jgi:hypothetical protein
MKVHVSGQIKTIPIHRTGHAAQKTIHPLTNGNNVDFHGEEFERFFILRLATQSDH